jgi:hypothetical protein
METSVKNAPNDPPSTTGSSGDAFTNKITFADAAIAGLPLLNVSKRIAYVLPSGKVRGGRKSCRVFDFVVDSSSAI